jgi:hypothetical protein
MLQPHHSPYASPAWQQPVRSPLLQHAMARGAAAVSPMPRLPVPSPRLLAAARLATGPPPRTPAHQHPTAGDLQHPQLSPLAARTSQQPAAAWMLGRAPDDGVGLGAVPPLVDLQGSAESQQQQQSPPRTPLQQQCASLLPSVPTDTRCLRGASLATRLALNVGTPQSAQVSPGTPSSSHPVVGPAFSAASGEGDQALEQLLQQLQRRGSECSPAARAQASEELAGPESLDGAGPSLHPGQTAGIPAALREVLDAITAPAEVDWDPG